MTSLEPDNKMYGASETKSQPSAVMAYWSFLYLDDERNGK